MYLLSHAGGDVVKEIVAIFLFYAYNVLNKTADKIAQTYPLRQIIKLTKEIVA